MSKIEDHLAGMKAKAKAGRRGIEICDCGTCGDAMDVAEKMLLDFAKQGHCPGFTEIVLLAAVSYNQPIANKLSQVDPVIRLSALHALITEMVDENFYSKILDASVKARNPDS